MGLETHCTARIDGASAEGKAKLETKELTFRGDGRRVVVPFDQVRSMDADDGRLRIVWSGGTIELALGAAATTWRTRIASPKSRLEKLGIKARQRVALVDVRDADLAGELAAREAVVTTGVAGEPADAIFFGAETRESLAALPALRDRMRPDGALWVLRPKAHPAISERDVMDAGRAAGLVDTKVVAFSATHTAEKFVIPRAQRGR